MWVKWLFYESGEIEKVSYIFDSNAIKEEITNQK